MRKINKNLLAWLLCLAVLLTGCTGMADPRQETTVPVETTEPAPVHAHDVGNDKQWMPWENETKLPGPDDSQYNYYLTTDLTLSGTTTLGTIDMAVCLNGHTVRAAIGGRLYVLAMDSIITVCDCAQDKGVIIPGTNGAGAFKLASDDAKLTLKDVVIDATEQGEIAQKTGAITIDGYSSELTLDGVTIQGCCAKFGSAIYAKGRKDAYATVNITNNSLIKGNIVVNHEDGGGAVMGQYATINVSDSTFRENISHAICGVALSFISAGELNLNNAVIVDNHSDFDPGEGKFPQVGAVYIHNGNRKVYITGNTVIRNNTRVDGLESNLYFQKSVRSTSKSVSAPLRLMWGELPAQAQIGIRLGSSYELETFAKDLNKIPLLTFKSAADRQKWHDCSITLDGYDKHVIYDVATMRFDVVDNEPTQATTEP